MNSLFSIGLLTPQLSLAGVGLGVLTRAGPFGVILTVFVALISLLLFCRFLKIRSYSYPLADLDKSLDDNCINIFLTERGHTGIARRLKVAALNTPGV